MDNLVNLRISTFYNMECKFETVPNYEFFPMIQGKDVYITTLEELEAKKEINPDTFYIVFVDRKALQIDWLKVINDFMLSTNVPIDNFAFVYYAGFHDKQYIIDSYKSYVMYEGANLLNPDNVTKDSFYDKLPLTVVWKVIKKTK